MIRCTINGREVEQMVDVRASLTDMLRGDFRLTSVKKGCEVGECGACNVLIDGECFNSCLYLAAWADGSLARGNNRDLMEHYMRGWLEGSGCADYEMIYDEEGRWIGYREKE